MATHGRRGPSRWVFGSVTEKVLRAASSPLLVVRLAPLPRAVATAAATCWKE
jgi:nucleotide-binding universal stress UspA family protein